MEWTETYAFYNGKKKSKSLMHNKYQKSLFSLVCIQRLRKGDNINSPWAPWVYLKPYIYWALWISTDWCKLINNSKDGSFLLEPRVDVPWALTKIWEIWKEPRRTARSTTFQVSGQLPSCSNKTSEIAYQASWKQSKLHPIVSIHRILMQKCWSILWFNVIRAIKILIKLQVSKRLHEANTI